MELSSAGGGAFRGLCRCCVGHGWRSFESAASRSRAHSTFKRRRAITTRVREFAENTHPAPRGTDDSWINAVRGDDLRALDAFTEELRKDYAAVVARLTLPYRKGPTEGVISKIKMLKRQSYNKASFPAAQENSPHRLMARTLRQLHPARNLGQRRQIETPLFRKHVARHRGCHHVGLERTFTMPSSAGRDETCFDTRSERCRVSYADAGAWRLRCRIRRPWPPGQREGQFLLAVAGLVRFAAG